MSSLGLGLGVNRFFGRGEITPSLSTLFRQRVLEDNGTFEAQACLQDLINQGLFDNANFVLTPNGYKAGKLYALKPESGDLDVDWARNGNATRVNKNRLIESVGNNVPRIDYLGGDCPSILVEPQRTNLVRSNFSEPYSNNLAPSEEIFHFQDSPFSESISNAVSEGMKPTQGSRRYDYSFPTNSLEQGKIYTFSWYSKNIEEPLFSALGGFAFFQPVNIDIEDGSQIQIESDVNGFDRFQINFSIIDETELSRLRAYYGSANGTDGVVRILYAGMQIEEGEKASSTILTDGSAVTRPADAPQPITVPSGTTEIVEALEYGTFNTITTIPATYTIPFGRFKYILFNGA